MVSYETLQESNVQTGPDEQGQAARTNSEKTLALADEEQSPDPENVPVGAPPDGGYGWVCVACCFWINAHTWGINSVRSDIR